MKCNCLISTEMRYKPCFNGCNGINRSLKLYNRNIKRSHSSLLNVLAQTHTYTHRVLIFKTLAWVGARRNLTWNEFLNFRNLENSIFLNRVHFSKYLRLLYLSTNLVPSESFHYKRKAKGKRLLMKLFISLTHLTRNIY